MKITVKTPPRHLNLKSVYKAPGSDKPEDAFAVVEFGGQTFTICAKDSIRIDFVLDVQVSMWQTILCWIFRRPMIADHSQKPLPPTGYPHP